MQALEQATAALGGNGLGPTSLYKFMDERGMEVPKDASVLGTNLSPRSDRRRAYAKPARNDLGRTTSQSFEKNRVCAMMGPPPGSISRRLRRMQSKSPRPWGLGSHGVPFFARSLAAQRGRGSGFSLHPQSNFAMTRKADGPPPPALDSTGHAYRAERAESRPPRHGRFCRWVAIEAWIVTLKRYDRLRSQNVRRVAVGT